MSSLGKFSKINENYIFHPRNTLLKRREKGKSSQSTKNIFYLKESSLNSFNDFPLERDVHQFKVNENTFYNKKFIPPIYFYSKVQSRYKYNMTSIPEYLLKTNDEKNFMDKLETYMKNENDKKILNELILNKEKESKIKDRYKPDVLDVQTILKYRPNLYLNSLKLGKKSTSNLDDSNNNKVVNLQKNKEEGKSEEIYNLNNKNNENEIKQLSNEDQVRYKYQISDIYNERNEKVLTNKSAEKYLFKNKSGIDQTFYTSSKSKSDWIPNRNFETKMNSFSSVSYNILSPMCKGFNKFITPTELNKNNLYNESPAFHKVKSISEFIDLTRVSSRNNLDIYFKNKKHKQPNFKFKGSIATDHLNAFHINRDLIPNPT